MENDKIINANCWVAYFDILGFKNMVLDFKTQYGGEHLDVFVSNYYFDILNEAKKRVERYKKLVDRIEHTWFSDTFLFYTPIDEQGYVAVAIESLARQFLLGCVWKRFPLAGALSTGAFFANKHESAFVGPGLIDANEYSEKQDWIGLVLTPNACSELQKFNLCPPDRDKYIEYDVPIKTKEKNERGELVLKMSTEKLFSFKMHKYMQVAESIRQMQQEARNNLGKEAYEDVKVKYENTLNFIKDTR